MKGKQLVEELFGERMHPEITKRAPDILKFLASRSKLKRRHLDLIWLAGAVRSHNTHTHTHTLSLYSLSVSDKLTWRYLCAG
jgi:hypothetical protein